MKPLHELNNVEKGRLLAALFPDELPGILGALKERIAFLHRHEDGIRKSWDENDFISAELWYCLASRAAGVIEKYGQQLSGRQRLFADQLFDGLDALFTIDCIIRYARTKPVSRSFRSAVDMLFEYEPHDFGGDDTPNDAYN